MLAQDRGPTDFRHVMRREDLYSAHLLTVTAGSSLPNMSLDADRLLLDFSFLRCRGVRLDLLHAGPRLLLFTARSVAASGHLLSPPHRWCRASLSCLAHRTVHRS